MIIVNRVHGFITSPALSKDDRSGEFDLLLAEVITSLTRPIPRPPREDKPFPPSGQEVGPEPETSPLPPPPLTVLPDGRLETELPPPKPEPTRQEIDHLITQTARRHDVTPGLLKALIVAESGLDPWARSRAGAMGLTQIMPRTAAEMGLDDPYDPAQNIEAGCRYLKKMLRRYDNNLTQALAAYNWGLGNLERHGLKGMPAQTRRFINQVVQLSRRLIPKTA